MNIGKAIREIRTKAGISQTEFANRCGLSQTSLSQIEVGVKRPSQRTIVKICEVFDIPEAAIYFMAIEKGDVSKDKRKVYDVVFPTLMRLALQLAGEHKPQSTGEGFSL